MLSTDDRLTHIDTLLAQQHALLVAVRGITERLAMQFTALRQQQALQEVRLEDVQQTLLRHEGQFQALQQTLDAIKDLLDRPNGH